MGEVAGFSVLALTVSLSLARPKLGPLRIHHSTAAVIGALLMLCLGILPLDAAWSALRMLAAPVVTIVSLMALTYVADDAGLFRQLARAIARGAGGSGPRLFAYLFFAGTVVGAIFTNDAAVVIFTPLVCELVDGVADETWTIRQKLPFYFSVLYVANVVGPLVTSNPINIIMAQLFDLTFLEYARWMAWPALVSVGVSFVGIWLVFARAIPRTYRVPQEAAEPPDLRVMVAAGGVLACVLAGFFAEGFTGIPVWLVSLLGAVLMVGVRAVLRPLAVGPLVRSVGWDVIVFVVGIFLVARGLKEIGLARSLATAVAALAGDGLVARSYAVGLISALFSAVMNNHPTIDTMAWAIRDLAVSEPEAKFLALSALIGGDLGPKMLPIGSLAALLWFGILRRRGVEVPYSLYIKVGVPVTLAALVLALAVLNLELG